MLLAEYRFASLRAMVIAAILWLWASPAAVYAASGFVSLGTGPLAGLYYPTGQSICDQVNAVRGETRIRCSVEATPGSVYNAEVLATGEQEFALIQSDVHSFAVNGEGRWRGRPLRELRSVMALYPELLALIARPDAGIAKVEDLKGKRLNIGMPGSGTRATWEILSGALGITANDLAEATELRPESAGERMCANTLDASLMIVGHPSKLVDAQLKACGLVLVPVAGDAIEALVASRPYYVQGTIPGRFYGLATDTPSFGGITTLMTNAAVPDAIVHAFTLAVMQGLDRLRQQPVLSGLDPKQMVQQSLIAPLHPGAARAYRELGLLQ